MLSGGLSTWRFRLKRSKFLKQTHSDAMRHYLETLPLDFNDCYQKTPYLAADLEMTGLEAKDDHILSFGFVPINHSSIQLNGAEHRLVSSARGVGQSATIHGIHDRDIEEADDLAEGLDAFLQALTGRILILHCAALDKAFLNRACEKQYGVPLLVPTIDTMASEIERLQRSGQTTSSSVRLGDCRRRYNLPDYQAHNALTDALATAELFLAQTRHQFGGKSIPLKNLLNAPII